MRRLEISVGVDADRLARGVGVAATCNVNKTPAGPAPSKRSIFRLAAISAVAAVIMLSARPVLAQHQCSSTSDQSAFEVQALRSELMVLATGCHDDEQYNAFIRRYQADLQANERSISAYFQHRYGRAAQTEHDRFVTDLANAISRQGSDLGGDFCPRNGLIFNEVLALQSASELTDFAAGKDLVPASVNICSPMPTSAARKASASVRKAAKRKKKK